MAGNYRKTLLVIGRVGHARPAFCKTLLLDWIKQTGRVANELLAINTQTSLRRTNLHTFLGEKIYMVDTPVLDSHFDAELFLEKIDELILREQLEIVGIATIINLGNKNEG